MPQVTIEDIVSQDQISGVFDVLMTAMENRLQSQFRQGRITGPEYANVYLGATTAILQQAIQFALTSEEAYQRGLLVAQQVLQSIEETELTKKKIIQTEAETANINAQILKVTAETANTTAQLQLIGKSVLRTEADIALVNQKRITETGQTENVSGGLIGKQQDLYDAQISGFAHDTAVKSAKVVADIWSVQKSTDPDSTEGLSAGSIQQVVSKMLSLG